MITRRASLALFAASGAAALAPLPAAAKPRVFQSGGIALGGTDPVGYFQAGAVLAGTPAHQSEHDGATWNFASAENKALFDADPGKYAPKYGGYCAYAVSKGGTAPTDPEAWTIHDGALYLNFSITVRGIWSQDIPGNIAKADANWPGVLA